MPCAFLLLLLLILQQRKCSWFWPGCVCMRCAGPRKKLQLNAGLMLAAASGATTTAIGRMEAAAAPLPGGISRCSLHACIQ